MLTPTSFSKHRGWTLIFYLCFFDIIPKSNPAKAFTSLPTTSNQTICKEEEKPQIEFDYIMLTHIQASFVQKAPF